MLRKSLLLAACFCFLAAPMAMARGMDYEYKRPTLPASHGPVYYSHGMCYTGKNGTGNVIPSATSPDHCYQQSGGQSWGYPGQTYNFNLER